MPTFWTASRTQAWPAIKVLHSFGLHLIKQEKIGSQTNKKLLLVLTFFTLQNVTVWQKKTVLFYFGELE